MYLWLLIIFASVTVYLMMLQGSIFFPLPDGTGMLYNLVGGAESPKAVTKLSQEVPCKTAYTEVLTVNNWLKKAQRSVDCCG